MDVVHVEDGADGVGYSAHMVMISAKISFSGGHSCLPRSLTGGVPTVSWQESLFIIPQH